MYRYLGLLLLFSCLCHAASAQSKDSLPKAAAPAPDRVHPWIRRFTLEITGTVPVNQFGREVPQTTKCDLDGNLYAFLEPGRGDVIRISADGTKFTTYSLADVPEMATEVGGASLAPEFTPGMDGELYIIVRRSNRTTGKEVNNKPELDFRIVSFDNDGKYRSQFKLESRFWPTHIAVFSSGDLLLTGSKVLEVQDNSKPVAFAGIFNDRGQLIKEIPMPEGVQYPPFKYVVAGTAQTARDGNVYVLYNTPHTPIYVLSPAAEIVKTVKLEEQDGEQLVGAKVAAGRLLGVYDQSNKEKPTDLVLRVFDAQTEQIVAEYAASRKFGQFACYTPEVFTFLRRDDLGRVEILRAEPR